jgi:archaemetzincin
VSILVVPIGSIDKGIIETVKDYLGRVFRTEVLVHKGLPAPEYAFNPERKQYSSSAILRWLGQQKEYRDHDKVLGVVDLDLYVPDLNFVFGQAGERVAIFSLARLRQAFYGLPEDKRLFHKRALTEAIHELGHSYGLGHCSTHECVMFFSNSIRDTDRKGIEFCPQCEAELQLFNRAKDHTAPAKRRRAPRR